MCEIAGKKLPQSPLSQFNFSPDELTLVANEKTIKVDYELNPELTLKSFLMIDRASNVRTNGSYKLENETFWLCVTMKSNGEAPDSFTTESGDQRMLLKLERKKTPTKTVRLVWFVDFSEDGDSLQQVANRIGMELCVAHYPSYCSKYNPIERRFFPHLTIASRV